MEYAVPTEGCIYLPVLTDPYFTTLAESGEECMGKLELINKRKNGFGDWFFYIRDERGQVTQVFEGDLEQFLMRRGVSELVQGNEYLYPIRHVRNK